jgi:hypothetical protein
MSPNPIALEAAYRAAECGRLAKLASDDLIRAEIQELQQRYIAAALQQGMTPEEVAQFLSG